MGQYERHVFVCTAGDSCPVQGDVEKYVKTPGRRSRPAVRSRFA
jgi:hypothetical protein